MSFVGFFDTSSRSTPEFSPPQFDYPLQYQKNKFGFKKEYNNGYSINY